MSLLFDRKVSLTFGKPGQNQTRVTQLFMQFDIEKTSESEPNKGIVQVHNLNPTSRSLLQQQGVSALLEAGYGDDIGRLAVGQVKHAPTERQGTDAVTRIEFQDGIEQYQNSNVSKSLGPGADTKQVLEVLASELQVGIGAVKGLVVETYQQGIALFGPVKDKLDEVTGKMGVEWSIQDNNLQILPANTPSEILGFLLTPKTGLIGSPTEREDSENGGKFIEFEALLRVGLKPGAGVYIASRDVTGTFKIRKTRFQGDNRKGPFKAICEAVEIESGAVTTSDSLNVNGTPLEVIA